MNIVRTDFFDFVVCGGGTAGFAAAVAAARKGLRVAIIEKNSFLGGVATASGVNQLLGGRKLDSNNKHVRVVGGIFDELTDRLIENGDAIEPNSVDLSFNPFGWYPRMASGISCNENALKIAFEDMCLESGVRIYYNTVITEAQFDDNLKNIVVFNKDGFVKIEAKIFADCTGDADIVNMCGLPFEKGRKEDGLMTPTSTEMHLENVDTKELVTYQNKNNSPKLVEIIDELTEKGVWDFPVDIFVGVRLVEEDVFLINTLRQRGVDGTKEEDVTKAIIAGRKDCVRLYKILKEYFPGFKNSRIRKIADHLGVRETRRIIGRETVTVFDALNGKKYDDTIAATTYNFDLPDPVKSGYDPMMGSIRAPKDERKHVVIRIPYGSLLPQGANNLIVAGRCISVEREVLGPARIMGPCMMMGQAAGVAASLANGDFTSVDIDVLRQTLWSDGVIDPDTLPFD